jgi:hypothetical protein
VKIRFFKCKFKKWWRKSTTSTESSFFEILFKNWHNSFELLQFVHFHYRQNLLFVIHRFHGYIAMIISIIIIINGKSWFNLYDTIGPNKACIR